MLGKSFDKMFEESKKMIEPDRMNGLIQIVTNFARLSLQDREMLVQSLFQNVLGEYPEEERHSVAVRITAHTLKILEKRI